MTLPLTSHDDSSRFDLIEGVRSFNYRHLVRPLLADYPRRVTAVMADGGSEPVTKEQAGALYNRDVQYQFACAIQRSMQQLAWNAAVRSVESDRETIAAQLRASDESAVHGRLELDPDHDLPAWYTRHTEEGLDDIHLVPGGYWADELVGAVYERGGSVYRLAWRSGYDAKPGALDAFVRTAPAGDYRRVLDLGCSFGGLTRVLRRVFADAEVIGIDISAAALRYAHQLTEAAGQEIVYAQRDATDTGYESDSFDLVTGFLLLHEVPDDVRASILVEARRLLKPGGQLMFLDIPPYAVLSPAEAYFESFDGRGNGENFWEEFLSSDFLCLLKATGFDQIEDGPLDFNEEGYWGSAALLRTGEFRAVHRWVTRAVKPREAEEGA